MYILTFSENGVDHIPVAGRQRKHYGNGTIVNPLVPVTLEARVGYLPLHLLPKAMAEKGDTTENAYLPPRSELN